MFFQCERIGRILKEIESNIYSKRKAADNIWIKSGDFKSPREAEESNEPWVEFNKDDRWGDKNKRYWFKTEVIIPEEFNKETVAFQIKTGREGDWDAINPQFLIYVNGKIVQGLDVNHREIIISECANKGEVFKIGLHAFSGMKDGLAEFKASITVLDKATEKLFYDIKIPLEAAKLLDSEDKRYVDTLDILSEAINLIDFRKPYSKGYYLSLKDSEEYLQNTLYKSNLNNSPVTAVCVGHTHIDVAWLWTLKQTREKVVRSFSTVLNLMDKYPEYKFMASQPQLLEFFKEEAPELYEKLKERVNEGRFEVEGAMWLEADCNLISGESIIRQIMHGKKFFRDEFGIESKVLWLPDVFGYSAAIPQILKKFNINYFVTSKISWNEYNNLPYDTFMWEGLDGTSVLSYFLTTADYEKVVAKSHRTLYEGFINPSQIKGAYRRYQQKNLTDEVLVPFGYGDGGGGPTKEMLENARRMGGGIVDCPKVKMGTVLDFFKRLEKKVSESNKLPRWVGELYLEYHRGTYTTMARNKRYNRKSEFLYEDIEFFNTLSKCVDDKYIYPEDKISSGWKTILLNQFHDIIPGSSIKEVYDESKTQYEKIIDQGNILLNSAIDNIIKNINIKTNSLLVFNQLGFNRSDIVTFEIKDNSKTIQLTDNSGKTYPVQYVDDGRAIAYVENIPSKGYKAFKIIDAAYENYITEFDGVIENKYFSITFDDNANIISLYDKENKREVLKMGEKANEFMAFEDKPHNFDAWDINIYYQEKMWTIDDVKEIKMISCGPVATVLKVTKCYLDSTIVQKIYVYNNLNRIDFDSEIDWKESQTLLKVAFPVDIHSNKATYETQFGSVERPTHYNTSWDLAKFEVPAHKWADLSEDNYGVSILNDCKYGHDIKDSVMRLTLIKSATWPNPDADKEKHIFKYSLYPHKGNHKTGKTIQASYQLNCPMYTRFIDKKDGFLPDELSFIKLDQENVMLEVVKKAEDNEDLIIRMYESYNRRSKVNVKFFANINSVKEVDLDEKTIKDLNSRDNCFSFEIRPFEIKTFRISLGKDAANYVYRS